MGAWRIEHPVYRMVCRCPPQLVPTLRYLTINAHACHHLFQLLKCLYWDIAPSERRALEARRVSRFLLVFALLGRCICVHRRRRVTLLPRLVKTGAYLLTERAYCLCMQGLFQTHRCEQFRGSSFVFSNEHLRERIGVANTDRV